MESESTLAAKDASFLISGILFPPVPKPQRSLYTLQLGKKQGVHGENIHGIINSYISDNYMDKRHNKQHQQRL